MDQPACVLSPSKDEGPYFVDQREFRSDIRIEPSDGSLLPGASLELTMRILRADEGCEPVEGAYVDIWHCSAWGIYSDVADYRTVGKKYLRGCQETDASGEVHFTTIVPGFYWNRAVHIHFKVRVFHDDNETYDFTSQLFFDQELINELHRTRMPYAMRGLPYVTNEEDDVFGDDGWKLIVPLTPEGDGFKGSIAIGLEGLPRT